MFNYSAILLIGTIILVTFAVLYVLNKLANRCEKCGSLREKKFHGKNATFFWCKQCDSLKSKKIRERE